MTEERIEKLTNYLREDQEKELVLLQMQPEEACIKIQADGYDYTVDEIIEYGNLVRTVAAQMDDEISEADLEMVSGGGITLGALVGAAFAVKVCYDVGRIIGKNLPW